VPDEEHVSAEITEPLDQGIEDPTAEVTQSTYWNVEAMRHGGRTVSIEKAGPLDEAPTVELKEEPAAPAAAAAEPQGDRPLPSPAPAAPVKPESEPEAEPTEITSTDAMIRRTRRRSPVLLLLLAGLLVVALAVLLVRWFVLRGLPQVEEAPAALQQAERPSTTPATEAPEQPQLQPRPERKLRARTVADPLPAEPAPALAEDQERSELPEEPLEATAAAPQPPGDEPSAASEAPQEPQLDLQVTSVVGTADQAQIENVLQQAHEPLLDCYRQAQQEAPLQQEVAKLALRISPDGQVAKASVAGPTDDELSACLQREASSWTIPGTMGGVKLWAVLRFWGE